MNSIDKEARRKKILECNSSLLKNEDFSIFDDNDVDVFVKLISFDSYQDNRYKTLSDTLKNNKEIVVKAAKCFSNISLIPPKFFNDKDVIKSIIYQRNEKLIPIEYLTEDIVNYMFVTCCRSSLSSDDIKLACDKHLKKESIIKVLFHQNEFYSRCRKEGSHPCIDDIYIPSHFFQDNDILQLLIIPQFKLIKDNDNITKEMILELSNSGYLIQNLPSKFFYDEQLVKECLKFEHNFQFFDDYNFIESVSNNPKLNLEYIAINPNVVKSQRYPLLFESFKDIFSKDIKKLFISSHVIEEDREKLFDYLTSEQILNLFENKDNNKDLESSKKYNFNQLYDCSSYYLNPIIDNKFIIEEMAKQDKVLFNHISEDIANDNAFMFKLFFEHKVNVDFEQEPIESLLPQIIHFGSLKKYLKNLKLEQDLYAKLPHKLPGTNKKMKI